jgi:hypothetical protein
MEVTSAVARKGAVTLVTKEAMAGTAVERSRRSEKLLNSGAFGPRLLEPSNLWETNMALRFEHNTTMNRQTRGLSEEALESFRTAFIGVVEFGHYFRITSPGSLELWRWTLNVQVGSDDTSGLVTSENEVRARITSFYDEMLEAADLVERHYQPQLQIA